MMTEATFDKKIKKVQESGPQLRENVWAITKHDTLAQRLQYVTELAHVIAVYKAEIIAEMKESTNEHR